MFSQSDFASVYHAIAAAGTAAQCTKAFVEALAPYGIDTLAAGEVDLADKDLVDFCNRVAGKLAPVLFEFGLA